MSPAPKDPAVRYHAKVDKRGPDECWPWTASCYKGGYGQFGVSKSERSVLAHRFGYALLVGPIPDGLCVLHDCDNPPCQNPAHWFLGTQQNNADDREYKSRGNHPRGERSGTAHLSDADVREVLRRYNLGDHAQVIANWYSISLTSVYNIVHGNRWAHVPRPVVTRKRDGHPKLNDDDVRAIRKLRAAGTPLRDIAEQFSVTMSNVSQIARGKSRADVQDR